MAASAGLTSATSAAFDVTTGVAAMLASRPSRPVRRQAAVCNAACGNYRMPPATRYGSTAAVTITITAGTGTAGAVLSGTVTVQGRSGVATFTDLGIDLAGYRLYPDGCQRRA